MMRHGETVLNQQKVYYGWTDVPLSPQGEEQCQQLKKILTTVKFDAVLASPLQRAMSSAHIVTSEQQDLCIYEDLKELNFGKWEGLHYLDIEKNDQKAWTGWCTDWINFCIPGGESFQLFYDRVRECFQKILETYPNKRILLVAHEGTLKVISLLLLKLPQQDYWNFTFEFGAYSMFELGENGATTIKRINCRS